MKASLFTETYLLVVNTLRKSVVICCTCLLLWKPNEKEKDVIKLILRLVRNTFVNGLLVTYFYLKYLQNLKCCTVVICGTCLLLWKPNEKEKDVIKLILRLVRNTFVNGLLVTYFYLKCLQKLNFCIVKLDTQSSRKILLKIFIKLTLSDCKSPPQGQMVQLLSINNNYG